jgi:ABC-2 type transport system ATP-binding protein
MTEDNVIQIANMTKTFDQIKALDEVNLTIEKGVFGLIGPNGAGKTTLLRLLLGLIRPTSGNAKVLGFDIQNQSMEIRKRVGVLHEKTALPSFMRARDYLRDVIGIYNSGKKPDKLLRMVDLEASGNRVIGNFSAGMHQRLGIALAFAGEPEIVFLDEPTSNLDVSGRDQILDLIVELYQKLGVTFIIASHILSELERVCSHVSFLNQGRIIEYGLTNDVISKHTRNKYRIKCTNSKNLLDDIKGIKGVESARAVGASVISIVLSENHEVISELVEKICESRGEKFYGLEKASTLEDAFREVLI